jgi:hypothetical protein
MKNLSSLIEQTLRIDGPVGKEFAEQLEAAQKFSIDLTHIPKEVSNGAEEYCRQLMSHGIFPLPFENCLFDFNPVRFDKDSLDLQMWVLAWKEILHGESEWRLYFTTFLRGLGRYAWTRVIGQMYPKKFSDNDGKHGYWEVVAEDTRPIDKAVADSAWNIIDGSFKNLLTVLGLLATETGVVVDSVCAPKFINAKRAKKGEPPVGFEHKIVRIDPTLLKMSGVVSVGGSHASPRLHWRRGHIRTLASGVKTQVRPCIVGDLSRGRVTHDYMIAASESRL